MRFTKNIPLIGIMLLRATVFLCSYSSHAQPEEYAVPDEVMNRVYDEIKTPYKYGLVMVPADRAKKMDCPSVFKRGEMWFMTYIVFDGRGYETWLAKSNPVINHHKGISGDAYLQKIDDIWVMFYFGAFWKEKPAAFNRFACSYDLVHWTDWQGEDLIAPSEPYDELFAHKSCVVKYEGVVYHFYCAVNKKEDRGIAVATSLDKGKSTLHFNSK